MNTDPYAPPAANFADSDLQVIHAVSWWIPFFLIFPAALGAGAFFYFLSGYRYISSSHGPGSVLFLWIAIAVIPLIFVLSILRSNSRNSHEIHSHPLVRDGQALYGGITNLATGLRGFRRDSRGILVITRQAVISSSLSTGRRINVPLGEIEEVTVRRPLLLCPILLDLHLSSGAVITLTIPRAKLWKTAIDQVRAAVAVVAGRPPAILP